MKLTKKYEMIILLTEEFTDNEVKKWLVNCIKNLKTFKIFDVTITLRGKQKLAYSIKNERKAHYIHLYFFGTPKYIKTFLNRLKLDSKVLRHLLINK